MRYLGGKSKIAKRLAQTIISRTTSKTLIEPFIGGGAMTAALAPHFSRVFAYDIHTDLILLWQALQDGWVPPSTVTEELYNGLKYSEPSALRGFVGFGGASWGGKWFGGYARGSNRNYADESARALLRDIKFMGHVIFQQSDYRDLVVSSGDVIYADPPYAETTGYSIPFDSNEFWEIADEWSRCGAEVFVSEYLAPPSWDCLWLLHRTRDMKADLITSEAVTEKLFYKGVNISASDCREQHTTTDGSLQTNREPLSS
jgi:DNA adenine methylase